MTKSLRTTIFLSASILFCSNLSNAQYPEKVTTGNETTRNFKLKDGTEMFASPRWIQTIEWQKGTYVNHECFAVAGDKFYIADRTDSESPRILRFNAGSGLFDTEITVDFGDFTPTDLGHLGNDDAGNLYIAASYHKSDHDHLSVNWVPFTLPDDIISVINEDGKVIRQWTLSQPKLVYSKGKKGLFVADVDYDRVSVRGNLITGENLIATLAVKSTMPTFLTWYTPNVYTVVDAEKNILTGESPYFKSIKFENPSVFWDTIDAYGYPEAVDHSDTDVSFNPVFWITGLPISKYEQYKDYFYAVASISPQPHMFRMSRTFEDTRYSRIEGDGFVPENAVSATGAIGFSYGEAKFLAAPYILPDESLSVMLSEYELTCDHDEKTMTHEASPITSFPEKTPLISQTKPTSAKPSRKTSTIVSVDNSTAESPSIDLYVYSADRGIARYTIADRPVLSDGQTGIETIEKCRRPFYVNGRNISFNSDCNVTILAIDGSLTETVKGSRNTSVNLNIAPGLYILKTDELTSKIVIK